MFLINLNNNALYYLMPPTNQKLIDLSKKLIEIRIKMLNHLVKDV